MLVKFDRHAMKADLRLAATVYEVKPAEVLAQNWADLKPKYRATLRNLRGTGVRFRLITDRHVNKVFAANVRFLLNYKKASFQNEKSVEDKSMDTALLSMLWAMKGPTTPQQILDEFGQGFDLRAHLLTRVWYFVATCTLDADLVQPLTMSTLVWPGQSHRPFEARFPVPKWRQPGHDWYR